jgi:hypothetical protein
MNMNKFSITLIAGALAAFMAATAPAQMISTQYAKKLVLADASASLVPLTLRAPAALTGAYSLTFPNAAPTSNGYLLSSATDGTLSWVDPTSYAFLTGVSHGATLTGAGTSGSPLDINLGNTNSWTAVQSFLANNAQGNVFVAAINAAASTINAVSVGIGLTDAQVSDNLTISGGTINNTPIGTTTASTGRFTTITGTSLPASSSSTDIVTSNGGDLETRTATTNATANTIVLRDNSGNFSAGTITAFLNGNVNGNINGNAVGFSGSLAGDVTGTQAATAVSLVGGSSATNVHSAELLANAATNLNTASTIVKRDGSGNFSAGTVTANLTGNASGSAASFTGSLVGDVTGTQGATVVSTVGTSTAANVHSAELLANAATNANTASTIVKRDASGNFSAGTITANLTGNASGTAANVTGTVAVGNGGTGVTTLTSNGVLYGNGTGIVQVTAASTDSAKFLMATAANAAPTWGSPPMLVSGGVQTLSAGNNPTANEYTTPMGWSSSTQATDATGVSRILIPRSGTVRNLFVKLSAGPGGAGANINTRTFTLTKTSAATSVTVSITGANTTGSDKTHSFTVLPGDEISLQLSTTKGGNTTVTAGNADWGFEIDTP